MSDVSIPQERDYYRVSYRLEGAPYYRNNIEDDRVLDSIIADLTSTESEFTINDIKIERIMVSVEVIDISDKFAL